MTAADFSYNTGSLRCPRCVGTGQVSLDVQFLPDADIACPACDGSRYAPAAVDIAARPPETRTTESPLPDLLDRPTSGRRSSRSATSAA